MYSTSGACATLRVQPKSRSSQGLPPWQTHGTRCSGGGPLPTSRHQRRRELTLKIPTHTSSHDQHKGKPSPKELQMTSADALNSPRRHDTDTIKETMTNTRYHESSRTQQHSEWNRLGAHRPQHMHMYSHIACD